jgi:hypothetical protein
MDTGNTITNGQNATCFSKTSFFLDTTDSLLEDGGNFCGRGFGVGGVRSYLLCSCVDRGWGDNSGLRRMSSVEDLPMKPLSGIQLSSPGILRGTRSMLEMVQELLSSTARVWKLTEAILPEAEIAASWRLARRAVLDIIVLEKL